MKKKINPQAMQIAACLHDWLEHHVPSIKACSRHTLRNYHVSMTLYAEFLRTVKGITPETMGHRTKRFFQWSGKMGERF